MFEIDDEIWTRKDLGVLDKVILVESMRKNITVVDEQLAGHLLLFTKCHYENVARSINKLIDKGLLTGTKIYENEDTIKTKQAINSIAIKQTANPITAEASKDEVSLFIQKFKSTTNGKYIECSKNDSVIVAEESLKLVISCFKNLSKKSEYFNTISNANLNAIYEAAINLKKKEVGYCNIKNPFAYITKLINNSIEYK